MTAKNAQKTEENNVNSTQEFKIKKRVTLPVYRMGLETPYYVKVLAPIFEGKTIEDKADKDKNKGPAHIMTIVDLVTGEEGQIVLNKVLKSTLEEEYPSEGYVGLGFQIIKHGKKTGKDYHTFSVAELEMGE